jgi:hypothetical protein
MSESDFGIGGTDVVVPGVLVVVGIDDGGAGEVVVVPGTAEEVSGPGVEGVAGADPVLDGMGPRPAGKGLAPESATIVVATPAALSSATTVPSSRP